MSYCCVTVSESSAALSSFQGQHEEFVPPGEGEDNEKASLRLSRGTLIHKNQNGNDCDQQFMRTYFTSLPFFFLKTTDFLSNYGFPSSIG